MKINQTKITAANSTVFFHSFMRTVIRMRKADPYARASQRREANPTEHATTSGRRVTPAETAGVKGAKAKAKANRRAKEDTPRVSMDRYHYYNSGRQVRERLRFKIICTSTAAHVSEPDCRTQTHDDKLEWT